MNDLIKKYPVPKDVLDDQSISFDEYKAFNKKWNKSKSGVFITKP